MSDRQSIRLEVDNADAVRGYKEVGQAATATGRAVEAGGQTAERGFRGVKRGADEAERGMRDTERSARSLRERFDAVGTAAGTLVGGLSLLASNARDQQREVDGLERAYGDASRQVLDFTERVQDSTNFSNDAARQAAATSATLVQNYRFEADQIEDLIARSADLAQVKGIDLADATQRVVAAMRGEAESAEALGLTLNDNAVAAYAASQGITGYSTTLSDAERAQVRYNYFLEQSAFAAGAAGDAAQGAAGKGYDVVHWLDDTAEAAGRALGPAGEFLSVAGNLALAAPLAGAGLGRLAAGVGALGAGFLGPAGLVLAAGAAGFALLELLDAEEKQFRTAEQATEATLTYAAALHQLAEAGGGAAQVAIAQRLIRQTEAVVGLSDVAEDGLNAWERYGVAARDAADEAGRSSGDILAVIDTVRAAIDRFALSEEQSDAITEDLAAIVAHTGENFAYLTRLVEEANHEYAAGRIDAETYAARIDDIAAGADRLGVALPQATTAADAFATILGALNAAQEIGTVGLAEWAEAAVEAEESSTGATGAVRDLHAEVAGLAPAAASVATGMDTAAAGMAAFAANASAVDLALAGIADGALSANDALGIFKLTQDGIIAGQEVYSSQLSEYNTQLGYLTEAEDLLIARREAGIALTQEEIAFLGEVDAAQARVTGGTEDATIALGMQALQYAENMSVGDALNASLGDTNDAITDLTDVLRDLVLELQGVPAEVRTDVVLTGVERIADAAKAAWDLEAGLAAAGRVNRPHAGATAAVAPAAPSGTGWPQAPANWAPSAGSQQQLIAPTVPTIEPVVVPVTVDTTAVATGVGEVERILALLVEPEWVVEVHGDGSDAFRVIKDTEGDIRAVVKGQYVVKIDGDNLSATQEIDALWVALDAIDGATATVRGEADTENARAALAELPGYKGDAWVNVYADTNPGKNAIEALRGYQGDAYVNVYSVSRGGATATAYRHGGTVPDARNGVLVRAGEAGAEWVDEPGGGGFLAARNALYVLEPGSYVHTAPATRAMLSAAIPTARNGRVVGEWEQLAGGLWRSLRTGVIKKGIRAEDDSFVNPGFFGDPLAHYWGEWDRLPNNQWRNVRTGDVQMGVRAEDGSYVNPGFYDRRAVRPAPPRRATGNAGAIEAYFGHMLSGGAGGVPGLDWMNDALTGLSDWRGLGPGGLFSLENGGPIYQAAAKLGRALAGFEGEWDEPAVDLDKMGKQHADAVKTTGDALERYVESVLENGEFLNDWLGHVPERLRRRAFGLGRSLAQLTDPGFRDQDRFRVYGDWLPGGEAADPRASRRAISGPSEFDRSNQAAGRLLSAGDRLGSAAFKLDGSAERLNGAAERMGLGDPPVRGGGITIQHAEIHIHNPWDGRDVERKLGAAIEARALGAARRG